MRGIILDWFVSDMKVPTSTRPGPGQEGWQPAKHLLKARIHSELGHVASWVEAEFAITSNGPFPWQRMKAVDRTTGTPIGIWRMDTVRKELSEGRLVWKVKGRDCLYGLEDNYVRTPLLSPANGYVEWPTTDVVNPADFEESTFPTAPMKLGPNYAGKNALRGYIFKDITRFSAGRYDSQSRPINAVYNRSVPKDEGQPLNSNFSLAQGVQANALERDIAKAWPWPSNYGKGIGWDYRQTWVGRQEPFSPSGQSIEVFPRGSQLFSPPCFGESPSIRKQGPGPCGEITVTVTYFQINEVLRHIVLDHFPTRAEICTLKPSARKLVLGMGAYVTVFPAQFGPYDLSQPDSMVSWVSRINPIGLPTWVGGEVTASGIGALKPGVDKFVLDATPGDFWCYSHTTTLFGTTYHSGVFAIYVIPNAAQGWLDPRLIADRNACPFAKPWQRVAVWLSPTDISKDFLCCR